ncbi:MAG: hypothetical protein EZS28_022678 [Streblomastix strix]|uniref:Uncharacterized protein n=1 Tax=Streblomastix strix TaxID=222440 RepID=A0A5J4VHH2_9EUKA|nr:MAG: hypothetical protein EZS28_022678 [Streblomastix strix]
MQPHIQSIGQNVLPPSQPLTLQELADILTSSPQTQLPSLIPSIHRDNVQFMNSFGSESDIQHGKQENNNSEQIAIVEEDGTLIRFENEMDNENDDPLMYIADGDVIDDDEEALEESKMISDLLHHIDIKKSKDQQKDIGNRKAEPEKEKEKEKEKELEQTENPNIKLNSQIATQNVARNQINSQLVSDEDLNSFLLGQEFTKEQEEILDQILKNDSPNFGME